MTELDFNVAPPFDELDAQLRHAIDSKTKPPGSLGRIEALAAQIGRIKQSLRPELNGCRLILFAGEKIQHHLPGHILGVRRNAFGRDSMIAGKQNETAAI